ncbi:disulfide bond formation protein B [Sedimenticola selenatireducens]|uniref:Disulfide bond formation protein B n=1 Tax=Sedimenticola selenatireducens TaxID=191960 RepID=A0A2N6CTD4_9GAMM|nr:disulfide bond formation protein B [Sedimenticola selenatireducens]PLX60382.1 MAG: disulfide bond formation protein B [Sedimenticola selenatireducens]
MNQATVYDQTNWKWIFLSWLLATVAMLGSLFFSEVMDFVPCVLCWYQRIFMYPLVVILLLGMYPYDESVIRYALPLAVIGWGFAIYHYLVYSGYIPEALQPCGQGPSCADIDLELFGFITIPMLSILAFSAIILFLSIARYRIER